MGARGIGIVLVGAVQERFHESGQIRSDAWRVAPEDVQRDHHDELGGVLLVRLASEQVAENRDVADAGHASKRLVHVAIEQSGNRERLAVAQLTSVSVQAASRAPVP